MQLDENLKSRVRFHLGFNAGAQIPAGDRARLEEAMALVPDEVWYNEIVYQVMRCDIAWKSSAFFPDDYLDPEGTGSFNFSRLESIAGDVSRSISTSDPLKADADFREVYLRKWTVLQKRFMFPTTDDQKSDVMHLSDPEPNLLWQYLTCRYKCRNKALVIS